MNYPLQVSFKLLAIAQQLSVVEPNGNLVFYVKQKAFKLKEAVTVFADQEQTQPLFTINANKILDFSASYQFADRTGAPLGSVRRRGMKSLWKAHYDIYDGETPVMMINEESAWTKVFDSLLGEVPLLGMFGGYFFHPAYLVKRPDETVVMRMQKQPAFFEGKFIIEKHAEMNEREELRAVLSLIMMVLLERRRG